MKITSSMLVVVFLLAFVLSAEAQVGLTGGTEYGLGFIAQVGSPEVKIECGGGLSPLFVFWHVEKVSYYGSSKEDYFKLYFPITTGAKLSFQLRGSEKESRLGLKLGAHYNTLMKVGYGGGLDYTIATGSGKIIVAGGLIYYPDAGDELLEKLNEEEDTLYTQDDVSSALLGFQPFISFSYLWGK